jgi:hypothetical protein
MVTNQRNPDAPMKDPRPIGPVLVGAALGIGLTQQEIATATGFAQSQISRWSRGQADMNVGEVRQFCGLVLSIGAPEGLAFADRAWDRVDAAVKRLDGAGVVVDVIKMASDTAAMMWRDDGKE